MFEMIEHYVANINDLVWGWPLVIFVILVGIIMTFAFSGVQFRYFFTAWRYVFVPEKAVGSGENYISPFQAFINTLSASIGNGSLAGMATAVFYGGPGAGFWIFTLGFLNLAIRFAEVLAATLFTEKTQQGITRGGPMVYLQQVPGGSFLPYFYAFFCLMLSIIGGNAMQCNSINVGLQRIMSINIYIVAAVLLLFVIYLMTGGAQRIMCAAEAIIPFKVGLFFIPTIILLAYNYASLGSALKLIIESAFSSHALAGGLMGYAIQDAIRRGMSRSLNSTEIGLGTAGILFGSTGSKNPMRSGIMSMVTAFVSNHLVCFTLILTLVVTGAYQTGLNSTAMTQAAYETLFGVFGSWLIALLAIAFGMGVLVAYVFIGRECWMFLTGGRGHGIYVLLFCSMTVFGTLAKVKLVWDAIDLSNAGLIIINLYALLVLIPKMVSYTRQQQPR